MLFSQASNGCSDLPYLSPKGRGRSRSAAPVSGEGTLDESRCRLPSFRARASREPGIQTRAHPSGFRVRATGRAWRDPVTRPGITKVLDPLDPAALHRALDRLEAADVEQHF